jgi:hypothetical protein
VPIAESITYAVTPDVPPVIVEPTNAAVFTVVGHAHQNGQFDFGE